MCTKSICQFQFSGQMKFVMTFLHLTGQISDMYIGPKLPFSFNELPTCGVM